MPFTNSTKYVVPRRFPADSTLGSDPHERDIEANMAHIAWKQPEIHEQYGSLYEELQPGEYDVFDLSNLTDAASYNSPHGPDKSGQRGGAD